MNNYLKIGKATELEGKDYRLYRAMEMLPGLLSWGTLLVLLVFSYYKPVYIAYFIIAFDVYWLLLVLYLGLHLLVAYKKLKNNLNTDWKEKLSELNYKEKLKKLPIVCLARKGMKSEEIIHLIIFTYNFSIKKIHYISYSQ